jgi:uncharacterized protein (TIGR02611 family)
LRRRLTFALYAPVAQWIRASGYGPEGRGFESLRAYSIGGELTLGAPSVGRERVGVARFVTEQRDKQILSQARPYLQDGEEVVEWVRAHEYEGKRRGYVFLTPDRLIVQWTDGRDRIVHFPWEKIDAWGVSERSEGPPVVGVETPEEAVLFEVRISSSRSIGRVKAFLKRLAGFAPRPRTDLRTAREQGHFAARHEVDVNLPKRSVAGHTKRIVLTILGLAILLFGITIVPLPGPWSAPLIIAGLAILATEYDWAEDIMNWMKEKTRRAKERLKARRDRRVKARRTSESEE